MRNIKYGCSSCPRQSSPVPFGISATSCEQYATGTPTHVPVELIGPGSACQMVRAAVGAKPGLTGVPTVLTPPSVLPSSDGPATTTTGAVAACTLPQSPMLCTSD